MVESPSVPRLAGVDPFRSMVELRQAHADLRKSLPLAKGASKEPTAGMRFRPSAADIRGFLARARATGAIIRDTGERTAAQGILDYWSTELVSLPGAEVSDFTPALLAPPEAGGSGSGNVPERSAATTDSIKEMDDQSRELIRLTAAARLWRDSGKKDGYLLWGDAEIDRAARFRNLDPDIDALVMASQKAATQYSRKLYSASFAVIVVLAALLVGAVFLWMDAKSHAVSLENETRELKAQSEELKISEHNAREALNNSRKSAEAADTLDRRLDAALTVLRRLLRDGTIHKDALPADLAAMLAEPAAPGRTQNATVPSTAQDAGYDAGFIGQPVPLPGLTPQRRRADYVNFSVALDTGHRMAAVSAANLDRDKRVVLPRAAIEFTPDPNLPRDIQADPDWFKSSQIDFGHLTTRQEISWGARFAGDDQDASRTLADSVNVLTNVAPQFDNFNRYVWARLEQWILTEHNKEAARVSIFTGPVFSSRDPQVDGAPMPRRFFKIAVSSKPGTEKALVVDAFMIAQFVEGTDDKLVRSDFAPAKYRVAVADIERATGLDFGAAVRNAPTSDSVPSAQPQPETSRPKDIVYFQFAGMSREDAVKLSSGLKALGWNIPGEERTGAAANQNEIRYGTKSAEPIANRLVEDLKALGVAKITAKLNPGLKQGPLEVWVSQ